MVHIFRMSSVFDGQLKYIFLSFKKHEYIMDYDSKVPLIFYEVTQSFEEI